MQPTSLAPMEGVTTFPTRLWIWWASQPQAMTTPFLRVSSIHRERQLPLLFAPELFQLRGCLPYDLVPQFLSADVPGFLRASEFVPAGVARHVELNCGCPCPTCIGRNAGSGILEDAQVFGQTAARLTAALGNGRLAIKMRLGYRRDEEFAALLDGVTGLPLGRLTIHGRTRADRYAGQARWEPVERAARRLHAPVWGSGDVLDAASMAERSAAAPSAAGIMIGRGAIRNPWIFAELRCGEPVTISPEALGNALLVFVLVHELSIIAPEKLISRLAHGHLASTCGTDADAWKKHAAGLSSLVCGYPVTWTPGRGLEDVRVSPTSFARLRYLWAQMQLNMPPSLITARIRKTKDIGEFLELLGQATAHTSGQIVMQPAAVNNSGPD